MPAVIGDRAKVPCIVLADAATRPRIEQEAGGPSMRPKVQGMHATRPQYPLRCSA